MPKKPPAEGNVETVPFAVVFPVEGRFLQGVPHVPLSAGDAIAARLVSTGAFSYEAPLLPEPDPETGITDAPLLEVLELPEGALAALDFYAPTEPEPAPAETSTQED